MSYPKNKSPSMKRSCAIVLLVAALALNARAESPHVQIGRFPQEVAACYTVDDGLPSNQVRAVHLGNDDAVFAETDKGWAVYNNGKWSPCDKPAANTLVGHVDRTTCAAITVEVNQVAQDGRGRLAVATDKGLLLSSGVSPLVAASEERTPRRKTDANLEPKDRIARADARFEPLAVEDGLGRRWGVSDVRGVAFDSLGQLWFATLAGAACQTPQGWKFYTGREGLPYNDFTTITAGPNGIVWFGTHRGAVRFDGSQWAYRQGRRWLPNDDVRGIAVDRQGNAWFATAGGVGVIKTKPMTLAEKAAFYEDEIERCIRRTPFGYVSEVDLGSPGDKNRIVYTDSDNDGLWTSMYGAGECFAYAATHNPKAKDRAKRAFEALRFLQKVTQGCEHSPPKGFVARTIRPADWPDPNIGRIDQDRKEQHESDPLWKVYEPRWPKSADGKWYWKSDTSSDELDGHYFFYPLYYDLVADTEQEKDRIRQVVRDLTDHLIEHDYCLVDHDGKPTRWGVYGPKWLNHDPHWWAERGLKSLSILSYLAVAEHITGDPKYGEHLRKLCTEHAYDANMMVPKIQRGVGSGNQSDDEMALMCFYNLTKYANDESLRQKACLSFYGSWVLEEPELNPFFNFAYAGCWFEARRKTSPTLWDDGIADSKTTLAPFGGWLDDSLATLKGFPLDRLNWASQNSHRLDIVRLAQPQASAFERKGCRVNGKVLPVENRHFNHWNTDPWELDYSGDGRQLASGTVFLLPYYMGLYHRFIREVE